MEKYNPTIEESKVLDFWNSKKIYQKQNYREYDAPAEYLYNSAHFLRKDNAF